MSREDPDIAESIHGVLSEEGIRFVLSAEPVAVQGKSGEGVTLTVRMPDGTQTIEASDILVAIRMRRRVSVWMRAGFISVNERLERPRP